MAPAESTTSPLARASTSFPPWRNCTPTARLPSNDDLLDQHAGFQPQVRTIEHRLQEGGRDRHAQPALLVDVEVAATPSLSPVLKSCVAGTPISSRPW